MQGKFSASVDEIAWVVTSYLVANGIMIPMTGSISSRFGRKRYSSFGGDLRGRFGRMRRGAVARADGAVQAAGHCRGGNASVFAGDPDGDLSARRAADGDGDVGVGLMVAPILGPTLGGWITDNWNWRWNFYINIPIGIVALVMVSRSCMTAVPAPAPLQRRTRRLPRHRVPGDWPGTDPNRARSWPARRLVCLTWVVAATACAALAILTLVVNELLFPQPIIDLQILKDRVFALTVILMVVLVRPCGARACSCRFFCRS